MARGQDYSLRYTFAEYENGGGGQRYTPPQPTPQEQAAARDWEAQQAEARAARAKERDDAARAAEAAEGLSRWQGNRNTTMQTTQDYGRGKLKALGLDTGDQYGIWDQFLSTLNRNNSGLQDNQDFSAALGTSVFDNILSDTRGATRTKLAKDFSNALGTDYYDTAFADTVDDSILDGIVGNQYSEAQGNLKNAFERGQLNNASYGNAMSQLDKRKSAARGELETIGRGVIGSARDATERAGSAALSRANNFDFTDLFDAAGEAGKVRAKGTSALSTLGTDIERAVGDRQFFDPTSIIAKSNALGGASNYTPAAGVGTSDKNSLYTVFDDQARKKQTEGVF